MPIDAVLYDDEGRQVRGFADPAGGTFDAAGDFDRLVGVDDSLVVWSSLDPEGEVSLGAAQARELLAEIPTLITASRPGPERRGLERLRVLIERLAAEPNYVLTFLGD